MAGEHVDWDLDLEIRVWKEREAKLAGVNDVDEMAKELSSPIVKSLRLDEPIEVEIAFKEPTLEQVAAKEPSVKHEKPV